MVAQLKDWRKLQARLLLSGFVADLINGNDDSMELNVTRLAQTRQFTDLAEGP